MYLKGSQFPAVTRCRFTDNSGYDMYFYNCDNYTIEENKCNGWSTPYSAGISLIIMNEVANNHSLNEFYRNQFSTLSFASLLYRYNRGTAISEGLKVHCNSYMDNIMDINVPSGPGISEVQGIQFQSTVYPAGNLFDGCPAPGGGQITDGEIAVATDADSITYLHNTDAFTIPAGGCYNPTKVSLINTLKNYNENEDCPSHFPVGGGNMFDNSGSWVSDYNSLSDQIIDLESAPPYDTAQWHYLVILKELLRKRIVQQMAMELTYGQKNYELVSFLSYSDKPEAKRQLYKYFLTVADTLAADSIFNTLCDSVNSTWCVWARTARELVTWPHLWEYDPDKFSMDASYLMAIAADTTVAGSFEARTLLELWSLDQIGEKYDVDGTHNRGSNEQSNEKDEISVLLYPNPTTGAITIPLPERFNEKLSVTVYDIKGSRVFDASIIAQHPNAQVGLGALPNGLYMVRITSESYSVTGRIVILR